MAAAHTRTTAVTVHRAATTASTAHAARAAARPTTYTVKSGDCLWSIGQRYDVDMYAMAEANGMQLNDVLYVGRVLHLPAAGTRGTPPASSATTSSTQSTQSTQTSEASNSSSSGYSSSHSYASSGSVSAGSGLEACIIARESGGNPNASNGSHWGLYQFSPSTWAAYGGSPSAYGSASAAEQQQVFNTAIAAGGASNWTPYDGC